MCPDGCLVEPSVPILFFGDLSSYQTSALKVVTVGLNPSNVEFPADRPFLRFPTFRDLAHSREITMEIADAYIRALSMYFTAEPYKNWFGGDVGHNVGFEPMLRGLGSSYYAGQNVALHTDICSPLATCPTWKGLSGPTKDSLCELGTPLWHSLIEFLEPDIMLVAVAKNRQDDIKFKCVSDWKTIETVGKKRRNHFGFKMYQLPSGKKKVVALFGTTAQTPYGSVSTTDKERIGSLLRESYLA